MPSKYTPRACASCGNPFLPTSKKPNQRYCSPRCGYDQRLGNAERFWARVDRSGDCWEWQGPLNPGGYGKLTWRYHTTGAHRVAWIVTYGEIPDGLLVCHRCDNPRCCRPVHLFLGTNADNSADRTAKGRSHRGEKNANAILTARQVATMRALHAAGRLSSYEIAALVNVSRSTVAKILRGQAWLGTHHPPAI